MRPAFAEVAGRTYVQRRSATSSAATAVWKEKKVPSSSAAGASQSRSRSTIPIPNEARVLHTMASVLNTTASASTPRLAKAHYESGRALCELVGQYVGAAPHRVGGANRMEK